MSETSGSEMYLSEPALGHSSLGVLLEAALFLQKSASLLFCFPIGFYVGCCPDDVDLARVLKLAH